MLLLCALFALMELCGILVVVSNVKLQCAANSVCCEPAVFVLQLAAFVGGTWFSFEHACASSVRVSVNLYILIDSSLA